MAYSSRGVGVGMPLLRKVEVFVRDMLAGAFPPPRCHGAHREDKALLQPATALHADCTCRKRRSPAMDSHSSSGSITERRSPTATPTRASGVGSRKGRWKLITKKGPNMIANANVLKASPP